MVDQLVDRFAQVCKNLVFPLFAVDADNALGKDLQGLVVALHQLLVEVQVLALKIVWPGLALFLPLQGELGTDGKIERQVGHQVEGETLVQGQNRRCSQSASNSLIGQAAVDIAVVEYHRAGGFQFLEGDLKQQLGAGTGKQAHFGGGMQGVGGRQDGLAQFFPEGRAPRFAQDDNPKLALLQIGLGAQDLGRFAGRFNALETDKIAARKGRGMKVLGERFKFFQGSIQKGLINSFRPYYNKFLMKKILQSIFLISVASTLQASPSFKDKECSSTLRELLINHKSKEAPKRVISRVGEKGVQIRMLHNGVPRAFRFNAAYLGKGGVEEGVMTEYSHIFQVSFFHRGKSHKLRLVIPATMADQVNMALLDKMKHLLINLSGRALRDLDEVALNPYPRGDDPFWAKIKSPKGQAAPEVSENTVIGDARVSDEGKGLINLYPAAYTFLPIEKLIFSAHHELGHLVAVRHFGELDPGAEWSKAISKDNFIISNYGNSSRAEDFAESLALYIHTDGGVTDVEILEKLAHRFEILDGIMDIDGKLKDELVSKILLKKMLEKNSGSQLVN